MSTILTKTELRASNDGPSVEIRAFDMTHENAHYGGVLTFEHRMHWKEALALGKSLVELSYKAAVHESEEKQWSEILEVDET